VLKEQHIPPQLQPKVLLPEHLTLLVSPVPAFALFGWNIEQDTATVLVRLAAPIKA
jgi:hypothetical protein